jgi:carboxypeptidase T
VIKMKKWLTVITSLAMIIAVLSGSLALADDGPQDDSTDGCTDDMTLVRVYYPDLDTGNKVLISFEPWMLETNYDEGYHLMRVTQREIDLLTDAGLQVVVADQRELPMMESILSYPCYQTVEETFAFAEALASNYPDLATWTDVGNSWEKSAGLGGYDMMVLRLTNSAIPGPKPKLFATSAIHAREYTTAPLLVRFAEYLMDNYGTDADVTWILDYHEVHLMFHANPDGRKKAEGGAWWRKNTNQNYCGATSNNRGADLNRNFSYRWGCCGGSSGSECGVTYRGPSPASERETQAVQNYLRSLFPDQRGPNDDDPAPDDATGLYLDFHSYGKLVLWPWGYTSSIAPNGTQLQTLGRKFAYWNDYWPQQAIGLYVTDGTTDDFGYGDLGVASYCFELGTAFFQSCSYFENTIVPDNMPALIYAAKVARTPYVTPAGPDAYNLSLSDDPVPAGTSVTLSGTINDTRYNNSNGAEPTQNIAAAEYYVDTPPWVTGSTAIAMSASDGGFNSKTENVEATIDTTGLSEGKHIVFVRGQDVNGNWGAFSAIFLSVVSYSIGGYVTGPEGANPLPGIRVDIRGGGSSFTDQDGRYSLEGLGASRYKVAPYDDGYDFMPACQWVVVPPSRDDVNFVGIPAGPPPGVTLYEHDQYLGIHETFTADAPDLTDNCIGDNIVTSIKIRDPYSATLYREPNYQGTSETFTGDDPQLSDNIIGNDTVSSICVLFADFDGNGEVDVVDIQRVASRWRMTDEDPDWDARYDLDGNGNIDIVDIMGVAAWWGERCE